MSILHIAKKIFVTANLKKWGVRFFFCCNKSPLFSDLDNMQKS
jgi:hypothetical protein